DFTRMDIWHGPKQPIETHHEEVRDTAVERDGLSLLEALRTTPLAADVTKLLDELVHDSTAGFIGKNMDEFLYNGYGIAKFRRAFFGNRGDEILRQAVAERNAANLKKAGEHRTKIKQQHLEAVEFARTRS
ncbi:MAG: hypothetical protein FWD12_14260, partial [Alphaproteobacteria bacterium]|nr:hypothetical protein [Alphaproteobacteria bacterium]